MARSIGESNSNPTIPDLKVVIPTIDELMRPPQPPAWLRFLPPPAPPKNDPFGPVPIIPPPPLEVDPPSRPPEWPFGPPYITKVPTRVPWPGPSSTQFVPPHDLTAAGGEANPIAALNGGVPAPARNQSPSSVLGTGAPSVSFAASPPQEKPGGLLGMMAEAGLIDPMNPEQPPPGGLLGLYREAMRNSAVQGGNR